MTEAQPWYASGLKFSCTGCGNCCTGSAGFTWVSEAEIDALAGRLGMDRESFCARYTRTVWRGGEQRVSLSEKRGGDCVFWRKGADLLDAKKILGQFLGDSTGLSFNYKTAAEKFQFIESGMMPIIIPGSTKVAGVLAALNNAEASNEYSCRK